MNAKRLKEFEEHRTSWKWFQGRFDKRHSIEQRMYTMPAFQTQLLLEILKELQFANDRKL